MAATVRIAIDQPRTLSATVAKPSWLEQLLQRPTFSAAASDCYVSGVGAGALFLDHIGSWHAWPSCTIHLQSMSCKWPFSHAQTKRIGVTSDLLPSSKTNCVDPQQGACLASEPIGGGGPACLPPWWSRAARRRTKREKRGPRCRPATGRACRQRPGACATTGSCCRQGGLEPLVIARAA